MVADSITDSQLFHGSPMSRDFVKKRKANWFSKLKQWKIDARRRQWISQWKKANAGEEENGCSRLRSLRDKPIDIKIASARSSYLQAWSVVDHHELGSYGGFAKCDDGSDDDETDMTARSPTSVLKNKDSDSNKSGDDCFCCSKQITEEDEEASDDASASESWEDALNSFDNEGNVNPFLQHEEAPIPNPNTSASQRTPAKLTHKDKCKQEPSPAKAIHHRVSREQTEDKCKQEPSPAKAIHHRVSTEKNEDKCKKEPSPAKAVHHRVSTEKNEDKCKQEPSAEKAVQHKVSSKKKKKKKKSDQNKEGDEDIILCPLCCEEMDATDLSFSPCTCPYKMCLYCHELLECCPVCKKVYDKTTSNSGEVSFQQRVRGTVRLSQSFKGLDIA